MKNGRKNFWRRFFFLLFLCLFLLFLHFSLFFLRICRSLVNKVARRTGTYADRQTVTKGEEWGKEGSRTNVVRSERLYLSVSKVDTSLALAFNEIFLPSLRAATLPPAPPRWRFFLRLLFSLLLFSLLRSLSLSFSVTCTRHLCFSLSVLTVRRFLKPSAPMWQVSEALFLSLCVWESHREAAGNVQHWLLLDIDCR